MPHGSLADKVSVYDQYKFAQVATVSTSRQVHALLLLYTFLQEHYPCI